MTFDIEIGTEEQKQLILSELELIKTVSGLFELKYPISKVIVTERFDEKINELKRTTDYVSARTDNIAIAKNIRINDEIVLVFSSSLYTQSFDNLIRAQFYLHETLHVINAPKFQDIANIKSRSAYQLLSNLRILYDEYSVDRMVAEIMDKFFPISSTGYKKFKRKMVLGFIRSLINEANYNSIKQEISSFRMHGNVSLFLSKTNVYFDSVSKLTVHSYAEIDQDVRFRRIVPFLNKSKFINQNTDDLINFFRRKYAERIFDLSDGLEVMENYFLNFGMKFQDVTDGLYCTVIDI